MDAVDTEAMGYTAERFVSTHASAEPNFDLTLEIAKRRAWFEYDWVGGEPDGGTPKPYTYLSKVFLPKIRTAGVDEVTLQQITYVNPFVAFGR